MANARIRVDGENVTLELNGRATEMPAHAAREIARALMQKALEAEEYARAEGIILDSALLIRAGLPFGLSNNPKILDEARKEAVWNRDLRRFMPGGVRSTAVVGTPTITQGAPAPASSSSKENAA
jgi:hypothetical protein